MIDKICRHCGKSFLARYNAAKYCSQHCSGKATSPQTQFKKGHTHSEESRNKISQVHIGRPSWNKGIKLNDEHIKKLKTSHLGQEAWNKGKKMPEEIVRKQRGENSHFWQGGITSEVMKLR